MTVRAVVFDVGGVLLDWNPRHLYRKLFDDEEAMERFLSEICTPEWHALHDRGVPFEPSCRELAAAHPDHAELIWAWARRSEEMIAGEIGGSVEILRDLHAAGVRCYALTNMEADTYPVRLARFGFMGLFDGIVVSAQEGISKPDVRIFRRAIERFGLDPTTTLFIDDSEVNVAAAESLGIQTIHYHSPDQLRAALAGAGLLSPATPSRT